MYHENREGVHEPYYCECGRLVHRIVVGYGPQTHIIAVDNDGNETCE